jgi:hypothetical protein
MSVQVQVGLCQRESLILGQWAIEVADRFPTAHVVGMDLSPIQPTLVPHNCEFLVGDLREDLAQFSSGFFNLVHSRYFSLLKNGNEYYRFVMAGVRENEWDPYINEVFRILNPGIGWAQFVEGTFMTFDGGIPSDGGPYVQVQF